MAKIAIFSHQYILNNPVFLADPLKLYQIGREGSVYCELQVSQQMFYGV